MSASLRTIWITIRATNYAVNTLTGLINQINLAATAEQSLTISNLNMMKSAMSAGILFGVLGDQVGGVGGQLMHFASYALYGMAAIQGISAAMRILDSDILTTTAASIGLNLAWWQLGVIIGGAAAIFMFLQNSLGTIPALIVAITVAVIALVAAVAILDALGGFPLLSMGGLATGGMSFSQVAAMPVGAVFQHGTRYVPQTGLAILHQGEIVYNPSTGRPTQVGNDLQSGTGSGTMVDASMHIGTVNTKMDTEEMNKLLKKQGRTLAQNNR